MIPKSEIPTEVENNHDRAVRLFTFLKELSQLQTKTIRSVELYEQVLWLVDIPEEPDCYCFTWQSEDNTHSNEIWVEIHKPKFIPHPKVPKQLEMWLNPEDIRNSSLDYPALIEYIDSQKKISEGSKSTNKNINTDPDAISKIWEEYVSNEWWPWAEDDKKKQVIQKIFTDLYGIYQQQQRLGEEYEIVLGLGYLVWKTPFNQAVSRHLITARASISFDATRGIISVVSSAEGARPTLEQDMLEPGERPGPNELRDIEQGISDITDIVLDTDNIHKILGSWINSIPESYPYDKTLSPEKVVSQKPKLTFAPAIILRKRTERNLVRVFSSICDQIQNSEITLPTGIEKLVKDPETSKGNDEHIMENKEGNVIEVPDEIYFPLPANDQQQEIVHQISKLQGVLVQGPPGTGKSHTIVNLICHLLATGKKVLITSHTTRALEVLRDKLPKEIAPLCVIALGSDKRSIESLEDSVRSITEFHNSWNLKHNRETIKALEDDIDSIRREMSYKFKELRSIRELETFRHPVMFENYSGTAQEIAYQLRNESLTYKWISFSPNEHEEPPLTNDETIELLSLLREFDEDKKRDLSKRTVEPDSLYTPSEFSSLISSESEAIRKHENNKEYTKKSGYISLLKCDLKKREKLLSALHDLQSTRIRLMNDLQTWIQKSALQILMGNSNNWKSILQNTKYYLDQIGELTHYTVDGLKDRNRSQVKLDATAILEYIESGKSLKWGSIFSNTVRNSKYLLTEVLVNGNLCNNIKTLQELLDWINIEDQLESLYNIWVDLIGHSEPSNSPQNILRAKYQELYNQLEECIELESKIELVRQLLLEIPGIKEPVWYITNDLESLEKMILAVNIKEELDKLQNSIGDINRKLKDVYLSPEAHRSVKLIFDAVQDRNEQLYAEAYSLLCDLRESRSRLKRRDELFDRLTKGSKPLSKDLLSSFSDNVWNERLTHFTDAWNWARTEGWLKRFSDPEEQQRLIQQLDTLKQKLGHSMAKLASAKAWQHCISRLTQHECEYLRAWALAVKQIRGKYADIARREARKNMEECRSAIPAWIMPIYRVVETVDIKPNIFDTIIIDEASQSGPEALFLEYIAKNIIVVGDDKQISPQFIGIDKQEVDELRRRYIHDLPHNYAIGVDYSFYDLASIRYQRQICLQEHFRCMPEIIQFSNNMCYKSTPLIPLKQYGAGRLSPTVKTVYIHNGYQKGRSPNITNPPEAESIVEAIVQCCSDDAYSGKNMGVITLLGDTQSKLIQTMLIKCIGPEEMEKRRLHCGNAYAFQGDERDVIFLSLVSAPGDGQRIGVLNRKEDKQRFNVAASRAKEQMWLFHSVTLNDLSPDCLRYSLLEYCQNPKVEQTDVSGVNIDHLRLLASTSQRNKDRPPSPFESWFEVDVFQMIHDHGYRIIPQYEVSEYRIDLLVEGLKGRLAVECDGDEWHGPERYDNDMARQRQLERCGYSFWRVRGSAFYHDPEKAMESLWTTLNRSEIFPVGQDTYSTFPSGVTSEQTIEDGLLQQKHEVVSQNSHEDEDAEEASVDGIKDTQDIEIVSESSNTKSDVLIGIRKPYSDLNQDYFPFFIRREEIEEKPYSNWKQKPLKDLREADQREVIDDLVDIVKAEGPMICHRAYRVYATAAGIKISKPIRSIFNRAMKKAVRMGILKERNEYGTSDQINKIVHIAGMPPIVLRECGDRTLNEVPPSEIAKLMQKISEQEFIGNIEDKNEIFRQVLAFYNLKRKTTNADGILERSWRIYKRQDTGSDNCE